MLIEIKGIRLRAVLSKEQCLYYIPTNELESLSLDDYQVIKHHFDNSIPIEGNIIIDNEPDKVFFKPLNVADKSLRYFYLTTKQNDRCGKTDFTPLEHSMFEDIERLASNFRLLQNLEDKEKEQIRESMSNLKTLLILRAVKRTQPELFKNGN